MEIPTAPVPLSLPGPPAEISPEVSTQIVSTPPRGPAVSFRQRWSTRVVGSSPSLTIDSKTGEIVLPGRRGEILGLDPATGKVKQWIKTDYSWSTGVALDADRLVACTELGEVVSFDRDHLLLPSWTTPLHLDCLATPVLLPGGVVVQGLDGTLFSLDAKDGHIRWRYHPSSPALLLRVSDEPVIVGDRVIAGLPNGKIVAIDLRSGDLLWEQTLVKSPSSAAFVATDHIATPVVLDRTVYAVSRERVAALDLNTGKVRWTRSMESGHSLAVDSHAVYVLHTGAKPEWVALKPDTGAILWTRSDLALTVGPVREADHLVVGDSKGTLYAIEPKSGDIIAQTFVDKKGIASLVAHRGSLYVANHVGTVTAFDQTHAFQ